MKKTLINLGVILSSILIGLIAMEAYVRFAQPYELRLRGTEIRLPYFQTYELINEWTGDGRLDPVAMHTKNGLGFRGANPPDNFDEALTVLFVGGSTTEGFYLDDTKTWPQLTDNHLQESFSNFWSNNAGLDGHSSFGHLHLFDQHLADLAPDAIVYLIGGNDMDGLIQRTRYDDTLNLSPELDPNRRNPVFREWLAKNSELVAVLLQIYERSKVDEIVGSPLRIVTDLPPTEEIGIDESRVEEHGTEYLPSYETRVRDLVQRTLDTGILPILMTHPAMFGADGTLDVATGYDLGRLEYRDMNGATAWAVLESYNDVTRAIAREFDVPMIDLARDLPKDSRHYIDQIHFSIYGADAVADFLAPRLCRTLLEVFPDHAVGTCPAL